MRLFFEHRLVFRRASDYGVDKTPKPMVMNQSLSANGKGIVQGPITTTNVKNGHLVGGAALPKAPTPSLPVGTGVAALDWAGRSQSHPQYGIPPSNPTEQQLNERYGVTPGWGVPNQGPNGSIDPRTGLQYSNSNNPGFGGGLQTTYNAIDAKYRAASDAGQSVDPTAVAAEKQAAAAQFQAEESARQGQMQAARDKEAKSVAMSQNALTAKTPQGQKIQQITAIRQNVRLGKITQEQANAQIQQIQSQSAASPQAPVAAPTSPTAPTPANPNASTATTPAVPGAAAVGTQEASATGTEPAVDENGNPIAKPPATPEEAGMDAAMLNLPPEAAFLAPFLQSLKTQTDKSIEENAQMALGQLATVEKTFGGIQDKLDGMEAGYKSTTEAMQSLLREAKESQEKQIAEAEKDQMNRVQWQQDTQERVIMKNKRQAHEAMVAQLALNGGFGQDASLRAVAESDDHFETQLADLRTEMGYARTDLSVKFSGLKNEATQNYVNSTITNMKELQANLEKIAFQGMSNKVSKMQAEQSIVKDAWEKQNTLRKELADKQYTISKDMLAVLNTARDDKRAQEQLGWQRMDWAVKTYGSNVPKPILESIGKQLPGVDVRSLADQMTLAEMKKKGSGGGSGGGLSFASYQMKAGGQPPSFKDFLMEKEKQALASGATKFDTSKAAMEGYQKEYDTRLKATNQFNPTEIVNRFKMKAGTLAGPQRKYAESTLNDYLASGQYKLASDFVDNTGDDIPATQANDYTQALNSRYNVNKMKVLFDEIGMTYPGVGTIRSLNPLDDKVVQYKQNLTQTIPGLARGIFKEVGVLTDSDIERYTSAMANPNLTVSQARAAFDDLQERIDVSMQNQLNVWDAGGKRVKGFRDLYEAEPLGDSQDNDYEDKKQSFLNSLPR